MLKKSYDVVIFGSSLSGLFVADLLRDRGARILLLNDEDHSLRIEKGYTIDLQMLPMGDIPDTPVVTNILGRLGLGLSNEKFFTPDSLVCQVLTNRVRIDLHRRQSELEDEIRREFPEDANIFIKILKESDERRKEILKNAHHGGDIFPPVNLLPRLGWNMTGKRNSMVPSGEPIERKIASSDFSEHFKKTISLCLKFATPFYPIADKLHYLPVLTDPATGYRPVRGMTGFKQLLLKFLEGKGVDIYNTEGMHEIAVNKKKVTDVAFDGGKRRVRTRALLFNSSPSGLAPLLPKGLFTTSYISRLEEKTAWGYWQSLFVGVAENKLPIGMKNCFIADLEGVYPVLVQMTPEAETEATPEGMRLMKISRAVPYKEKGKVGGDDFEAFEKRVVKMLRDLIPFLDNHYEIIYRHDTGALSPDDHILCGDIQSPPGLGTQSPLTPYQNLFLSGREIMAVLGIEGDFLAADMIADKISDVIAEKEN